MSWLLTLEMAVQRTLECMYPFESCFSLGPSPGVGLQGHSVLTGSCIGRGLDGGWAGGANQGRLLCRQCSWNRTTSTGRAQPRGVPCALLPVGMTWHVNLGHHAPDQCKPSSKRSEKILNTYSRDTRFAGWQKKPSRCLSWFSSLHEALCMRSELGGYLAGRIRRKQGEFKNIPEG